MKLRHIILTIFFALLFLTYPGDSTLLHTYAYHRELFRPTSSIDPIRIDPYPIVVAGAIDPTLSARSVFVVDRYTLTPVLERAAHAKRYPASTTKIITALTAFDRLKPENIVTVKQARDEGQIMELVTGERITFENLLYGTLVHSGNDAALALADHFDYDTFITMMNKKAQELHMDDTNFANPSGLHDPAQVSSAYDLAIAGRALLDNSYLSKIVSTKQITVSDVEFRYFHPLSNVNQLLGEIPGVGGLKTGYTPEAGENLVTLYRRPDGYEMLIVILGSEDRFEDTRSLVNWINTYVQYVQ